MSFHKIPNVEATNVSEFGIGETMSLKVQKSLTWNNKYLMDFQ